MIDLERVIDLGSDGRVSDVFQTVDMSSCDREPWKERCVYKEVVS